MPLTVSVVLEGSIADRKHIEAGDVLYSMNGNEVKDFIDFIYFEAQNKVTLEMKTCSGKQRTVKIVKSEYEHIGIAFEGDGIGNYQPCINKYLKGSSRDFSKDTCLRCTSPYMRPMRTSGAACSARPITG